MGCQTGDRSWWIATTCRRLLVFDMLLIECHPPHLLVKECLWHHYFRTRNIVTLVSPVDLCYFQVTETCHEPSPLLVTNHGSNVLQMYEMKGYLIQSIKHSFNWLADESMSQYLKNRCDFCILQSFVLNLVLTTTHSSFLFKNTQFHAILVFQDTGSSMLDVLS